MRINKIFYITLSCILLWSGIVLAAYDTKIVLAAECASIHNELAQLRGLMQRKSAIEKGLQKCKNDPTLYYFYAYNLDRRRKPQEALKYYLKSIAREKNNYRAFLGMGNTYRSLGQTEKAIHAYEQGLLIDPGNKHITRNLNKIKENKDIKSIQKTLPPEQINTSSKIEPQPEPQSSSPDQIQDKPDQSDEQKTVRIDQEKTDEKKPVTTSSVPVDSTGSGEETISESTLELIATPSIAMQESQPESKQIGKDKPLELPAEIIPPTTLSKETKNVLPADPVPDPVALQDAQPESKQIAKDKPLELAAKDIPATLLKETKSVLPAASVPAPLQDTPPLPDVLAKKQPDESSNHTAVEQGANELTVTASEGITITSGFTSDLLFLIQFTTGKYKQNKDTRKFIKQNICTSLNNEAKSSHFEFIGHTNDISTMAVNQRLSLKRAGKIRDTIVEECEIVSDRLHVVAYGESQPMVPNISTENRAENRRVEIKHIQ